MPTFSYTFLIRCEKCAVGYLPGTPASPAYTRGFFGLLNLHHIKKGQTIKGSVLILVRRQNSAVIASAKHPIQR